jgi:hypothetical protein
MDLPLYLEHRDFVYGDDQSKQTLTVILKNAYGSFLQAYYLGSQVAIHQPIAVIEEGIKASIRTSLPLLELQEVKMVNDTIFITVAGFSGLATYNFSREDLEGDEVDEY